MDAIANWFLYNRRRVLAWFKDDVFRRLFVNAGKLLSANAIAAVLGLVATVLTARALGPQQYGVFAVVLVYQLTVSRLVTFNAWQAIIKFGSEALHADDLPALRKLIKFGFTLDVTSAVVGTVLAVALSGPVISLLGWDRSIRSLLVLYSVLILFSPSGTPIGVLRLFDRFDLLSYIVVFSSIIRLAGVCWCFISKEGVWGFVLIYLIAGITGQFCQLIVSLWVLRGHGVGAFLGVPLCGVARRFPDLREYIWTAYADTSVRMFSREADELVIAGFTTPAALGVFKIAKQFARVLPRLVDPLYQSIFPELSRLWHNGEKERLVRFIKRTTFLVGVLGIAIWGFFVLCGGSLIRVTVGPEYASAYWVTVVYLFALVIALVSFSFTPLALSVGKPRTPLKSDLIATTLYFIVLVPLLGSIGIVGASIAYVLYFAVWVTIMLRDLRFVLGKE